MRDAVREKRALSIGLLGNCADVLPELVRRGLAPDVVTDQTSAHDPLNGYVPGGMPLAEALELRTGDPERYIERAMASMADHVRAMLAFLERGSVVFDYGNNLRGQALAAGVEGAFDYPGFVPAYIRPLFCCGKGPFRWVALSGDPEDIRKTDDLVLRLFPDDAGLGRWIRLAREKVALPGAPGAHLLARLRRARPVRAGTERHGGVRGTPRAHRDRARPPRQRLRGLALPRDRGMKDGTDAVADWPILNALVNAVAGATWVSFHHGGGVGIGKSLHAGMVVVADGTPEAGARLERVLTTDPGMGVVRHADAGYDLAKECARTHSIKIPMAK